MAKENQNSSSQPILLGGAQPMERPKGLLEAISEIQYIYAQEMGGADIPANYFTVKNTMDFSELGIRATLLSGLVMSLLTPIAIGVFEKNITVFGSIEPNLFDQCFVFLISLSYMLGYASFIGWGCTKYYGEYTQHMVKNLMFGVLTASAIKGVVMFLFFHFCYMVLFTKSNLLKIFAFIGKFAPIESIERAYLWCIEFRHAFIVSAWFVLVSAIIYCLIIYLCYYFAGKRNKRIRESSITRA